MQPQIELLNDIDEIDVGHSPVGAPRPSIRLACLLATFRQISLMRVHTLNAAIKIVCIGAELRGISDARLAHRLGLPHACYQDR